MDWELIVNIIIKNLLIWIFAIIWEPILLIISIIITFIFIITLEKIFKHE